MPTDYDRPPIGLVRLPDENRVVFARSARQEFDELVPRKISLQAQAEGQRVQLRIARQNLERCRITSPLRSRANARHPEDRRRLLYPRRNPEDNGFLMAVEIWGMEARIRAAAAPRSVSGLTT